MMPNLAVIFSRCLDNDHPEADLGKNVSVSCSFNLKFCTTKTLPFIIS